jgi:hypothetical protein
MSRRRNTEETLNRYVNTNMMKRLSAWPGMIADYTIGTVIVLALLATSERRPHTSRALTAR